MGLIPPHIIPAPSYISDIDTFSDASSGAGTASLVGQKWKAWRLLPRWQTDDQDIALELIAHAVVAEHGRGRAYRLYCDNRVVVEGCHKGRSCN